MNNTSITTKFRHTSSIFGCCLNRFIFSRFVQYSSYKIRPEILNQDTYIFNILYIILILIER